MQTFVSFLRGVNMAGHNKIKMTDLVALFDQIGFKNSETFIQSGNVIFNDPGDRSVKKITTLIEEAINEKLALDIPAIVRSIPEMKDIISGNPFLSEIGFDPSKMAVMFLHDEPGIAALSKMKEVDYPPDKFRISGKEIFIWCPNGFGRTKLYTNFFENRMKVTGTARNWNTINTILEIAEKKKNQSLKSKSFL
jgi:uncharacterized protein (DUF1697 family)